MKSSNQRASANRQRTKQNSSVSYDSLEARLPLTSFVVNVAGDAGNLSDGLVSLREASIAANTNAAYGDAPAGSADGDVIQFDSSIVQVDLTEGPIELTDDVVIQSGGSEQVVVTASRTSGLFEVATNERVSFGKLYLYNGFSAAGGAVRISGGGITNFSGMTFIANSSTTGAGGAIHHSTGRLNIADSVFKNNQAQRADGGAIVSFAGTVNVRSTVFDNNFSLGDGAAIKSVNGTLNTSEVRFEGNKNGAFGNISATGGALDVDGTSIARINGGSFEGNWSSEGGGGIWLSENSTVTINSTSFSGNFSNILSGAESGGGGIANAGGNLLINNATFSGNSAGSVRGTGGAIFSHEGFNRIVQSDFDSNSASESGGAISISGGRLVLRDGSTLSGDEAGLQTQSIADSGQGGGIYVSGEATVVLSGVTVSNATATQSGGGIWMSEDSRIRVSQGAFDANTASGTDVGTGGGAIFNDGGSLLMANSSLEMNEARAGGAVYLNGGELRGQQQQYAKNEASRFGGAIANFGGQLQLSFSEFTENSAVTTSKGGAIYVGGRDARTVILSSSLDRNTADAGAGVFVESSDLLLMFNSSLTGNVAATESGGGINSAGYLRIGNVDFENNSSGKNGGGVFVDEDSRANIRSGKFEGNSAIAYGGGIFDGGVLQSEVIEFLDNSAGIAGDSIFEFPV